MVNVGKYTIHGSNYGLTHSFSRKFSEIGSENSTVYLQTTDTTGFLWPGAPGLDHSHRLSHLQGSPDDQPFFCDWNMGVLEGKLWGPEGWCRNWHWGNQPWPTIYQSLVRYMNQSWQYGIRVIAVLNHPKKLIVELTMRLNFVTFNRFCTPKKSSQLTTL